MLNFSVTRTARTALGSVAFSAMQAIRSCQVSQDQDQAQHHHHHHHHQRRQAQAHPTTRSLPARTTRCSYRSKGLMGQCAHQSAPLHPAPLMFLQAPGTHHPAASKMHQVVTNIAHWNVGSEAAHQVPPASTPVEPSWASVSIPLPSWATPRRASSMFQHSRTSLSEVGRYQVDGGGRCQWLGKANGT